jgi:hypothetical protein
LGRAGRDPRANGAEPELIVTLRCDQQEVVGHVAPVLPCLADKTQISLGTA